MRLQDKSKSKNYTDIGV